MTDRVCKIDNIKWVSATAVALAALYLNYHFSSAATSFRIIGWLLWFVLTTAILYSTKSGRAFFEYYTAAKTELRKVHWPIRQETIQTTLIIILVVSIVGVLLWCVDTSLLWTVGKITRLNG